VLDLLRLVGKPLGVQHVAEQAGLHPNTAVRRQAEENRLNKTKVPRRHGRAGLDL
jgi:hypothetical protein